MHRQGMVGPPCGSSIPEGAHEGPGGQPQSSQEPSDQPNRLDQQLDPFEQIDQPPQPAGPARCRLGLD